MSSVNEAADYISEQDLLMLQKEGSLTPASYEKLQRANYQLTGSDQVKIAAEIARRFQNGNVHLPDQLKNVLLTDVNTRRLIKRLMTETGTQQAGTAPPLPASTTASLPGFTVAEPTNSAQPPKHAVEGIGYTVETTERTSQRSDADSASKPAIESRVEPAIQVIPVNQPVSSWVEALTIHHQLEASEFSNILPQPSKLVAQFLRNDGYLANEELARALYDETLNKAALSRQVTAVDPELPATFREALTNYLWAMHERIQESPLTASLSNGLLAPQFDLLLPRHAEHLRQALTKGGYLTNPTIGPALYTTGLDRATLNQLIVDHNPAADPDLQRSLSEYLWDVHKSVVDQPLVDQLDPAVRYWVAADSVALSTDTGIVPDKAVPELHRLVAGVARAPARKSNPEYTQKAADRKGLLRTVLGLRTFEGSMLTNLLHNYQSMARLGELLFGSRQTNVTSSSNLPQPTPPSMTNTADLAPRWNWKQIEKQALTVGLTKETLKQNGTLDDFLRGRPTGIMTVQHDDGTGPVTAMTGKLYITEVPGKGPMIHIQPEQHDIRLPRTFLGHELTSKDINNLLKTGEMGRLVDLTDTVTADRFRGYIALDTDLKRLTVLRADRIYLPSKLKGVDLTPQQQADLRAGRPVRVDGLKNENGQPYNAFVQVSAAKRSLKFTRMPEQTQEETATPQQKRESATSLKPVSKAQRTGAAPSEQQQKHTKAKQQQPGNEKKDVSVVAKNGSSRTTVQSSKAGSQLTRAAQLTAVKMTTEVNVNGQKTAEKTKRQPANQQPKGPKH